MNCANLPELPVKPFLAAIAAETEKAGALILSAAPGAGKTTLVPLVFLATLPPGNGIILLEPRRVAVKAAAHRLSSLLGEETGRQIGFAVRGETRLSPATRITVMTPGVFLRKLHDDPGLDGTKLLIFDEFHERSLENDLALALTLDARRNLRPDLHLLVMSATLGGDACRALPGETPRFDVPGKCFPVKDLWSERTPEFRDAVPAAVRGVLKLLREEEGDLLVFLPGAGEIERARTLLNDTEVGAACAVLPLHGSLPLAEQERALRPGAAAGKRRIILATNVAETGLTVEGVSLVLDSGLERVMAGDPATGIPSLQLRRISQASAIQRRGRAGRLGPGVCLHLYSELEFRAFIPARDPEILSAELSAAMLSAASWGTALPDLPWCDAPPAGAVTAAGQTLTALGALDEKGGLTERGRRLARLPVHPRLGAMLLAAEGLDLLPLAAETAALLEERDLCRAGESSGASLEERVRRFRADLRRYPVQKSVRDRLLAYFHTPYREQSCDALGLVVAAGFPEWTGRRRANSERNYRLSGGSGAALAEHDPLGRNEWLACAALERTAASGGTGLIRLAAPVTPEELELLFPERFTQVDLCTYDAARERVTATRQRRFGMVVLDETPLADPDPASVAAELVRAAVGSALPPADAPAAAALLDRLKWAKRDDPSGPWPGWEIPPAAEVWTELLTPYAGKIRTLKELFRLNYLEILENALSFEAKQRLERDYPAFFTTPAGCRHRIDYSGDVPAVSAKVQEFYGVRNHPSVGRNRLPLKVELLNPAGRPVQITSDLPGFWRGSWALVAKEMRSRYPKHFWPDDPAGAAPSQRTVKKR